MNTSAHAGWEQTVERIIHSPTPITRAQIERWSAQYAELCPRRLHDALCGLDECTAGLPHCQPGRMLLFRGEPRISEQPAVAALMRAHLQGANYSPDGTEAGLLEQLREDIALFRPTNGVSDSDELFLAVDRFEHRSWQFGEGGDAYRGYAIPRGGEPESLLSILFNIHLINNPFSTRDPRVGVFRLDPFVSFSVSPAVALSFAQPRRAIAPGPGRIIVASIPRRDLNRPIDPEQIPPPGQWASYQSISGGGGMWGEEREVDAILYPPAEDIVGSVTFP